MGTSSRPCFLRQLTRLGSTDVDTHFLFVPSLVVLRRTDGLLNPFVEKSYMPLVIVCLQPDTTS